MSLVRIILFSVSLTATVVLLISAGKYRPAIQQFEKTNTTVDVDVSNLSYTAEKIFLSYYNSITKIRFTDSVIPGANKIANFSLLLPEPILGQLRIQPQKRTDSTSETSTSSDNLSVYLEPGKIVVLSKDSLKNGVVTGSRSQEEYLILKKEAAAYDNAYTDLYNHYGKFAKDNDRAGESTVRKQIDSLTEIVKEKVYKKFIIKYGKTSPVALYALSQYSGYSINPQKVTPVYNLLGASIKNLPAGKLFQQRIALARQLQIGKYALPFSQTDTAGRLISLSSFKGKYVLIDFWASWCGPCRAENPNVVEAFQKYKNKNFTIIGVSLDKQEHKEKWLKAIHDDKLDWTHLSDLKFWDNEVAKLYDIKAIPQNILIDKEGKIVAKNIRGEELQETLKQILN